MNRDFTEENGGASITPSARKSIHFNRNSELDSDREMVRYGLNKKINKRNPLTVNEQGQDEVDNVMSKMARSRSPLTIRKDKLVRTNSYPDPEENKDNYSHELSKSLPTTLPSHLYYSDDDDDDVLEQNHSGASLKNLYEPEGYNQSPGSLINSRLEGSHHSSNFNRSNFSFDNLEESYNHNSSVSSIKRKESKTCTYVIIILSLGIGVIAMYYFEILDIIQTNKFNKDQSTQTVNYDKILFEKDMNNLRTKYNIDDSSILKLTSGIKTIFSRMDAGSFIFIYNSETQNFNLQEFEKFINEVAHTSARYLRNDISSIKDIVILSTNLDMQEHGELINRYRDDVDKSGVLLVKEVDSVPSDLAMAFHYYCDEYNPLVKRSAIFFTLDLANCSQVADKKPTHDFIEKCLSAKWKTVPEENIRPLLARMVDVIIDVTSVF